MWRILQHCWSNVVITCILLACTKPTAAKVYTIDGIDQSLSNQTFDYVIVGCGIAGLVVANRLSEDPNSTVICLEAGPFDQNEQMIRIPFFIGQQPPLFYEWGMNTTPQHQLDGQPRPAPCGRGVGGGSLINGMLWNRGSQSDFDAWRDLGNEGWGWRDLLPYFRKSEMFTPQAYAGQSLSDPDDQLDSFNPKVHGFRGPVQISYPKYLWPQSWAWFQALEELGVPKCNDPNDGSMAGGYFIPLTVHPSQQTRSDTRQVYWDPVQTRANLHIAVNAQVLRVLFDDEDVQVRCSRVMMKRKRLPGRRSRNDTAVQAIGVEFAYNSTAPVQQVFAAREVILAAGGLHTPHILEHSGIGEAAHLSSIGVNTFVDLPGVGNNLQDHAMIHLNYHYRAPGLQTPSTLLTNSTFNAESEVEYYASRTGPWTAKPSTAVAFPSLQNITNTTYTSSLLALASLTNSSSHLPPNTPPSVLIGYSAQLPHILRALNTSTVPSYEILNDNAGGLDLGLMRPLSRGTVHSTNSSPWMHPEINPNWLAHPLDRAIMLHAMEFNARLLATPQLSALMPTFDHVPSNTTQEQLASILNRGIGTEYHFAGAAAMLPRSLGGVVDPALRVYGTQNLRVVDSSVFPVVPGAHLMSVVYAVAEKAADVIKGDWEGRLRELEGRLNKEVPGGEYWGWLGGELGLPVGGNGSSNESGGL